MSPEKAEGAQDFIDDHLGAVIATKEPKDLGVKIASKVEALWSRVRNEAMALLEQSKNNQLIQEAMLKLADEKIAEEKATWNQEKPKV